MKKTEQLQVRMDIKLRRRLRRQSRKRGGVPLAQLMREYANEILDRLEAEEKATQKRKR